MEVKNMKTLILYFSRTGMTDKAAHLIAQSTGGDLLEVRSDRYPRGLGGYLRAMRDAFREPRVPVEVPIQAYQADLSRYDLVVIGTPVWNGLISAPIRSYLRTHAHELKQVAFFVTCGGGAVQRAHHQLRSLCGKEPVAVLNLKAGEISRPSVAPEVQARVEQFARSIQREVRPEAIASRSSRGA
jgi:flavodoxin